MTIKFSSLMPTNYMSNNIFFKYQCFIHIDITKKIPITDLMKRDDGEIKNSFLSLP